MYIKLTQTNYIHRFGIIKQIKHGFSGNMQFMDWSVNFRIAIKAMFYLVI